MDGIRLEREWLKDLRKAADQIVDTSHYNIHELKARIVDLAQKRLSSPKTAIHVLSFGFKYGIPHDADLIIDVRFLANPYFSPELKELTGREGPVRDYVLNNDVARAFLRKYMDLLDFLIPLYEKEGKAYLTIAIGCTGGRHRSVAVAQSIYEGVNTQQRQVSMTHRDIEQ